MSNLPPFRGPIINRDGTASREFSQFLDLLIRQADTGAALASSGADLAFAAYVTQEAEPALAAYSEASSEVLAASYPAETQQITYAEYT